MLLSRKLCRLSSNLFPPLQLMMKESDDDWEIEESVELIHNVFDIFKD